MAHTRAVVVADGDVDLDVLADALQSTNGEGVLAIAADGGALHLAGTGRIPDVICGDGDSLPAEDLARYRDLGVSIQMHPRDKDQSDAELALRVAIDAGASEIDLVGALGGGRIEHAVANQLLLAEPFLDGVALRILHGRSWLRRIGTAGGEGSAEIRGEPGDFVSLLPLDSTVTGITTMGLRFPLSDEPLPLGSTRGLSNELEAHGASVSTRSGRLLIVFTPLSATLPRGEGIR